MQKKSTAGEFQEELSRSRIVAERAHYILINNIREIRNVNDWAKMTGCSRRWLGQCIKIHFEKLPRIMLREERYHKIQSVIEKNPRATATFVASCIVHNWNEKNLYTFLSTHYKTNFTSLRDVILKMRYGSGRNRLTDKFPN